MYFQRSDFISKLQLFHYYHLEFGSVIWLSTSSEGRHSGNSFAGIIFFFIWMDNRIWTALTHHFRRIFAPRCPCHRFKWNLLAEPREPVRAAGRMSAGPIELSNIYFASRIRVPVSLLQIKRLSELYAAWNCAVSFLIRFQKLESCKKYINLHVQLKLPNKSMLYFFEYNELWKSEQSF